MGLFIEQAHEVIHCEKWTGNYTNYCILFVLRAAHPDIREDKADKSKTLKGRRHSIHFIVCHIKRPLHSQDTVSSAGLFCVLCFVL